MKNKLLYILIGTIGLSLYLLYQNYFEFQYLIHYGFFSTKTNGLGTPFVLLAISTFLITRYYSTGWYNDDIQGV